MITVSAEVMNSPARVKLVQDVLETPNVLLKNIT